MKRLIAAAMVMTLIACSDAMAPKSAQWASLSGKRASAVDINQKEPFATNFYNSCAVDIAVLEGTNHIILHTTTSASGNEEYSLSMSIHMDGFGVPSDDKYIATSRITDSFNMQAPLPLVKDYYESLDIISASRTRNFHSTLHVKLTINANGVVTAEFTHDDARCVGPIGF